MNSYLKGIKVGLASLTMVTSILSLGAFAALPTVASAVAPADYGLHEGDTIRATGDLDIYIVNDWGYKRLFVNPAIFNLYGQLGWSKVKTVSPATRDAFVTSGLFRNCETGDQKVYGLDVVSEDVANLRWVNTTGAQAVADDPNFFKKVFCINTNEQHLYGTGADFTSVNQVPNYARGETGVTPTTSGPISVSLSSDNPASNTLISGQAAADLAHFTFTGSGAVTSVKLMRTGVSSDTSLSNVYLYQGNKRLTDAATVSQGNIVFSDTNGLFQVSGSTTISVKADVASGLSGQTVGVSLTSVNGNTVSLSGNLFQIAAAPSDFGTVAVGAPTPSNNLTLDPQNDYTGWQSVLTIGNHDAWLKSLQLRVIGSVQVGDLRNFRLQVDGVQVGSAIAQTDSNGYLVFDLGAGTLLKTGTRTVKLLVDVVGGSNRNFIVSLRQKPDIQVVESQYNQPILPTGTFPATAPTQTLGTEVQAINSGTLTITKTTDSPSGDIVKDSAGVAFTRYTFEAHGEALKVENLLLQFVPTNDATLGSIRNGAVFVDGAQVGSIQNISSASAGTQFNLGSSLVIQPGTPRTVEIRGDVYDNTGTNNMSSGDTFHVDVIAGSSNVQRLTSLNYFSNTAPTSGNTLTVKTGSFTANKYTGYANQSVVAPKTAFKIGHYTLTAASSENLNVNTINVDVPDAVNTGAFTAADLNNMYLKVWSDTGSLVYTSAPKSTVSGTASNSYSVNFVIPMSKTYQVEVYSDIGSNVGTATLVTNLDASGLTTSSNTTATATEVTGQSITAATGSLTLANGASPASRLIDGGKTITAYVFTLQPQYDTFTLDEAGFNLSSSVASSTGAVAMVNLKDSNGTLLGSVPMASGASISLFSGLNYPMSQTGGTKTFIVEVQLSNVGVGANDTGGDVKVRLSHLKYRNSNGSVTVSTVDPTTYLGNDYYAVRSYPSFTNQTLPSTVLAPGQQTLFKTNVTANGNTMAWRKIVFDVSVTAHPTITSFKLFENGVDISSLASVTYSQLAAGHNYATASANFNVANASGATGQVIWMFNTDRSVPANGSVTLELKGTVGGANVAGDSISTQIANPNGSTFVASDDVVTLGGTAASGWRTDVDPRFLWSDLSAPTHSSTTDDWYGDALVTGIAAAQSLYQ